MKNYFKILCFASSFAVLTLAAGCSDDDDDSMDPTPEEPHALSFASTIKPIIESSCAPCHVSGGSGTDYTMYANAKSNVDGIVTRIEKDPSEDGFMPLGGSALSTETIDKIKGWKTAEFPE